MIAIDDVQLQPKRVPVGGNYLLRIKLHEEWAEGTLNNPIPYKHLMSVTEGLYYSYKGNTYRCLWSTSTSLTLPGTAPSYWQPV